MGLAAAAISLVVLLSGSRTGSQLVDRTDSPAPAFSLSNLLVPTRDVSLSQFRGERLVLNFWSSWCVACRIEMPLLEAAYSSGHGNVKFLGIDTNDSRSAAQGFLARVHVTYPCAFDPDLRVASAYGIFGLPVTVFISPDGRMLGRHIGQFDASTLNQALQRAFGGTGTP